MTEILQGSIWWLERPDDKRRPCLVISRPSAIPALDQVLVAPLTTRVRGLDTEVHVGADDGVPRASVVNLQHTVAVPKWMLTRPIGRLAPGRWHEVCDAVRVAIGC